jgi:hypothetical protein
MPAAAKTAFTDIPIFPSSNTELWQSFRASALNATPSTTSARTLGNSRALLSEFLSSHSLRLRIPDFQHQTLAQDMGGPRQGIERNRRVLRIKQAVQLRAARFQFGRHRPFCLLLPNHLLLKLPGKHALNGNALYVVSVSLDPLCTPAAPFAIVISPSSGRSHGEPYSSELVPGLPTASSESS